MSKIAFREQTTYNTVDTRVTITADRAIITNGVKERCEIVLRHVLKYEDGIDVETLTETINIARKSAYRVSDIQYALTRLHKEAGVLTMNCHGLYEGVPSAKALWKKIVKTSV